MIKSIAVKCQTCIIGAVGHYQAAETGLLLHLSTVWSLAVIQIQCVYVHRGDVDCPQAPRSLPPTPFWTAKSQFYADFGSTNRHSLQYLRVSAARTIHYGLPLYL